jgi:hypothetical protein
VLRLLLRTAGFNLFRAREKSGDIFKPRKPFIWRIVTTSDWAASPRNCDETNPTLSATFRKSLVFLSFAFHGVCVGGCRAKLRA